MAGEAPELLVDDVAAWHAWLSDHHGEQDGIWVVLAKKGITEPTTLTYDEALLEALAHGWIDGQVRRRDVGTYKQRFTPRRSRSQWSRRNVALVERLTAEGRMHAAGVAEVERAKADGRWEAAYAGASTIAIPPSSWLRSPPSHARGRRSRSSTGRTATRSSTASQRRGVPRRAHDGSSNWLRCSRAATRRTRSRGS